MHMQHFYVSLQGEDLGPGTVERPFKSLHRAQQAARAQMSKRTVIHIRAGTYYLIDSLQLSSVDNDHDITYQPYGYGTNTQEDVVLSGGRVVSEWRLHDAANNIWRAEIGDAIPRQFFVNGNRARRAKAQSIPAMKLTKAKDGYLVDGADTQAWGNGGGIEFVYTGAYPWSEARVGVERIDATANGAKIVMRQPSFQWAHLLYNATSPVTFEWAAQNLGTARSDKQSVDAWDGKWRGMSMPTAIENNASFLINPGTFVVDTSVPKAHALLYIPRASEDMASATATIPNIETLLLARGNARTPLKNIRLRGLTFIHTSWEYPITSGGFMHYHGNSYYAGGGIEKEPYAEGTDSAGVAAAPELPAMLPGALMFTATTGLVIEQCHFTQLGADALVFDVNNSNTYIRNCRFDDISGGGISVGIDGANRDIYIEDNSIDRVGQDYPGSAGILLENTAYATVAHNRLTHLPHCGIVANGGDNARAVHIRNNYIQGTMEKLADGGGVYLSGKQGDSYASSAVVTGNVIRDTITPYNFGLYADYGAEWVIAAGNIVQEANASTILQVTPPQKHMVLAGNFWDSEPFGEDAVSDTVVLTGNKTLAEASFEQDILADPAGADIVKNAGPRQENLELSGG